MRLRAISYGRVKRNGGEDPHLLPSFSLHILLFSPFFFLLLLSTSHRFPFHWRCFREDDYEIRGGTSPLGDALAAVRSTTNFARFRNFAEKSISRRDTSYEIRKNQPSSLRYHRRQQRQNYRRIALARLRYRNDLISGIIKF